MYDYIQVLFFSALVQLNLDIAYKKDLQIHPFAFYKAAPLCLGIERTEALVTYLLLLQEQLDMLLLYHKRQAEILDVER